MKKLIIMALAAVAQAARMATLNCGRFHRSKGIVIKSRKFIVTVAILSFFPSVGLADEQIKEEQAIKMLTDFIKNNHYYDFSSDCLRAKSLGYKNAGYTIELTAEGCPGNRPEGIVGRWRVDAKTAKMYVQNEEGEYASPTIGTGMLVPFVGCNADGQVGPLEAPKSASIEIRLDAKAARRLALYQAEVGGIVVGPRGWSCFGTYGSGGSTLYVTPEPLKVADMLNSKWQGIKGFGIEGGFDNGETSGRFAVARIAARVFPKQRPFVESVIAEGLLPASDFPFGPFPADRLTYLNEEVVEYETSPRSEGLGTLGTNGLRPNSDSIHGVVIWFPEGQEWGPSIAFLALRLPQNMKDLVPTIIKDFENRNKHLR